MQLQQTYKTYQILQFFLGGGGNMVFDPLKREASINDEHPERIKMDSICGNLNPPRNTLFRYRYIDHICKARMRNETSHLCWGVEPRLNLMSNHYFKLCMCVQRGKGKTKHNLFSKLKP